MTRFILHMVPANSYLRAAASDVDRLAATTTWTCIHLPVGHTLLWSSDDQKRAFLGFGLPVAGKPSWLSPGRSLDQQLGWTILRFGLRAR